MGKIKDQLNQQGFKFSPQEEIERKALTHRKIKAVKKRQHQIHTLVKLGMVADLDECRELYKKMNREIIKLESEL